MTTNYHFTLEAYSWAEELIALLLEPSGKRVAPEIACANRFIELATTCLSDRTINPSYVARVACETQYFFYQAFNDRQLGRRIHLPVAVVLEHVVIELVLRTARTDRLEELERLLFAVRKGKDFPDHIVPQTVRLIHVAIERVKSASNSSPASS
jgi:hypothetical protein